MNATEIESEYPQITVITSPDEAHLVFDSVAVEFFRMNGWVERSDSYQVAVEKQTEVETVTIPQYLASTNRYYFVQSESFNEIQ